MIFVDTNVLIRLMTDDVPHLREQAEVWVKLHAAGELFIPDVSLTELFFVLQNNPLYRLSREQVCESLAILLRSSKFFITPEATTALELASQHPKLDFTDCMLAAYANQKTDRVLTFDKGLLKILS